MANIEETCDRIRPTLPTNFRLATPRGTVQGTVVDVIRYHQVRVRQVNSEILNHSYYLASEVIDYMAAIEELGYFGLFDSLSQAFALDGMTDMSIMAGNIFDYLQLADHLDDYRREFLHTCNATGTDRWKRS